MNYEDIAVELADRIYKFIPDNPEIMFISDPSSLFKIKGFKCDDLQPSFFQVGWALAQARKKYEKEAELKI